MFPSVFSSSFFSLSWFLHAESLSALLISISSVWQCFAQRRHEKPVPLVPQRLQILCRGGKNEEDSLWLDVKITGFISACFLSSKFIFLCYFQYLIVFILCWALWIWQICDNFEGFSLFVCQCEIRYVRKAAALFGSWTFLGFFLFFLASSELPCKGLSIIVRCWKILSN